MDQHGYPTLYRIQISEVDEERKGRLDSLGPFGIPFAPRIDEIAPTSVTDSSLGPQAKRKKIDHLVRHKLRHTYPHVRPVFRMKFLVAYVVLSARHDPHVPKFRDLRKERTGILVERMERRNTV